ncbi:MAG: 3-dehydroquinate synthase [Syntrophotaleaceae bacterium]
MVERIRVGLGDRAYPIWIGEGILQDLDAALKDIDFPKKVALVCHPAVHDLYGETVLRSLAGAGFSVAVILVPEGEEHKDLATLETIYDALIRQGFDRGSGLIALGGGVIGDMAGFAAATFLRGIPYVQVPTTLLAQVDSSVGGKTAVNHPLGKNLIGAFYQPRHVHIDVATLKSLPGREFCAGMAEVVKYGVIRDAAFFQWLEEHRQDLLQMSSEALVAAVKKSCQIKANVVETDEKESSVRAILNFGHTFGHAVETLSGYGEYRHGEAVAIGMVVAADISRRLGFCDEEDVRAITGLLNSFRLPTVPPPHSAEAYREAMMRDKKVQKGVLRMVFNQGIGDCRIEEISNVRQMLSDVLQPNFSG